MSDESALHVVQVNRSDFDARPVIVLDDEVEIGSTVIVMPVPADRDGDVHVHLYERGDRRKQAAMLRELADIFERKAS